MFARIEMKVTQPKGTITMPARIYNSTTRKQETLFTEYVTPEQAKACAIPAKQEIQLDYAKIAELQAWQKELLAKFGK